MNQENKNQSPGIEGAEQAALNGSDQFDEARLTAYVLGELDGEEHAAEREAVERQLAESEAARAAEAEIRRSVELMTAALATEPAGELTPAGRESVESRIEQIRPAPFTLRLVRRKRSRYRLAAVAACLLLGFSGWLWSTEMRIGKQMRYRVVAKPQSRLHGLNDVARGSVEPDASIVLEHSVLEDSTIASKSSGRAAMDGAAFQAQRVPATPARPNDGKGGGQAKELGYTPLKPDWETKSKTDSFVEAKPTFDANVKKLPKSYAPSVLNPIPKPASKAKARVFLRNHSVVGADSDGDQDQAIDSNSMFENGSGYFESRSDKFNTEAYSRIVENAFLDVRQNPLSTFSIDVDTASYANVRRFLTQHALPPKDAVRIEELVNYFKYDYSPPADGAPFAVHAEIAGCPWAPKHRLLRVALKGREIDLNNRPASNLVFLIDVSGSMDEPNKLPLLKAALRLLVDRLSENDRIAMVVYAGSSGLVLPSTTGDRQAVIAGALEQLQAGGSTNGASGIQLAYETARQNFIRGGVNRVILCTDGDFNVGVTDEGALTRLIETEAKSGVFLSVLGFGGGNLKDATMEKLGPRQRQLRLHRQPERSPQGAGRAGRRHAGDDRQGREAATGVQPEQGGGLSAGWLREPHASQRGFQRRHERRRRDRRRAYGNGVL